MFWKGTEWIFSKLFYAIALKLKSLKSKTLKFHQRRHLLIIENFLRMLIQTSNHYTFKFQWFLSCFSLWGEILSFLSIYGHSLLPRQISSVYVSLDVFGMKFFWARENGSLFRVILSVLLRFRNGILAKSPCSDVTLSETIHLSTKHSYQLSQIAYLGIIEEFCLLKFHNLGYPELTAVYSSDLHFGGLDFEQEDTKSVNISKYHLACEIFVRSQDLRKTVADDLKRAVYFWF